MIHAFSFKNFYSFRDLCEVSFEGGRTSPENARFARSETGARLSKPMAVIGPNGSGKTNLIKALSFLVWFIEESFAHDPDAPLPIRTHFFSDEPAAEFDLRFDHCGELWRYLLTATPERVLHEALLRKTGRAYSHVFKRQWNLTTGRYEVRQQGFGLRLGEAVRARGNASLIATAAQYGIPLATRLTELPLFTNLTAFGADHRARPSRRDPLDEATWRYLAMPRAAKRMSGLLTRWDLGLHRVDLRPARLADRDGQETQVLLPLGIHSQDGREVALDLAWESSGTQGAYRLLSHLLPALETGGIAVIDELESDLHPHMLVPILDLFISPENNPRNAQLLFTCHAPEVLNLLHPSQIILVEKDARGESEAWRLDSVRGVRGHDNLYGKYMAGAYAAIPDL